jgi:hypothetical protein
MAEKKKVDISENLFNQMLTLFKDEYGQQLVFTPTQRDLMKIIAFKKYSRVGVICPTQYGKSTATACGVILRAVSLPEKFTIIGGTQSKAEIIMGYLIDHLFDSEIFLSQLKIDSGLEKLKREKRRDHLTFKRGGEVKILSAEYKNRKRLGEALIGEGSQNVIIDDSCLCDDDQYSYTKRMIGGKKDNFILELSNPLRRNHFLKTMATNKRYHKIWIDWKVAVDEGRFTEDFINEMREEMFFDVFYDCKFPSSDMVEMINGKEYLRLLTDEEIENAIVPEVKVENDGRLGIDIGKGGNYNAWAWRKGNVAKILATDKNPDLMATVGRTILLMKDHNVKPADIAIDDTGVGGGVVSRLKEQKFFVSGIEWGSSGGQRFANSKAECYWRLRDWIKAGGKIEKNDRLIEQLKIMKYRIDSSGRIAIMSKNELIGLGYDSPDEADGLAFTFAKPESSGKSFSADLPISESFGNNEFSAGNIGGGFSMEDL